MNARFDFPDGTVTTEHQVLVETLNQFLAILPDDEQQKVVIRLGMALLELAKMWAGPLLHKFIRRPATLYLVGKELHVIFNPFPDQEALHPLLGRLNAKRVALPWLNGLVVQLSIAHNEPLHLLAEPEKRKRLFGDA